MNKKRILIFASGRGSNAEAIHEAVMDGRINGEVVGVICDHKGAQVLERAARWHVPSVVIEKKDYPDKAAFDEALLRQRLHTGFNLSGWVHAYMRRKSGQCLSTPGLSIFIRRCCQVSADFTRSGRLLRQASRWQDAPFILLAPDWMTARLLPRQRFRYMITIQKKRYLPGFLPGNILHMCVP